LKGLADVSNGRVAHPVTPGGDTSNTGTSGDRRGTKVAGDVCGRQNLLDEGDVAAAANRASLFLLSAGLSMSK